MAGYHCFHQARAGGDGEKVQDGCRSSSQDNRAAGSGDQGPESITVGTFHGLPPSKIVLRLGLLTCTQ